MYQYPYGNAQQLNLDWILSKLKELESGAGGGTNLEEVSNALIALTYAEQNYNLSDIVFHDGKLYSANQNITAEPWNPAHWNEMLLATPVSNLVRYVSALNNSQVTNVSNVSGTHTSDALNNLASDINDLNGAISKVFNAGTDSYADCNTFKEGLFKYGTTTLNIPESGYGFVIGYIAQANSWKWQIAITTNDPVKMFARNNINNSGWSDWKRIANEDDISSLSGAINALCLKGAKTTINQAGTYSNISCTGLTANHKVCNWGLFSNSDLTTPIDENNPPADIVITEKANAYDIVVTNYSSAFYIQPTFVLAQN